MCEIPLVPEQAIEQKMAEMNVPEKLKPQLRIIFLALITSQTNVPYKPSEFNHYIRTTDDFQLANDPVSGTANYLRFGWLATDSNAWTACRADWKILYEKYTDKSQATATIRAYIRQSISDFHKFSGRLINKIKACDTVSQTDADKFHFVLVRKKKTTQIRKITEECFGIAIHVGTGILKMKVKSASDAKRASIFPDASGVQVAYKIVYKDGGPIPSGIPKAVPDETYTMLFFTKAIFRIDFGGENSGAIVQVFFRWFVLKKMDFSGQWSQMITTRIL